MSDRKLADALSIHPKALAIWGEATCIVALEVARDLRSGVIPPCEYDQGSFLKIQGRCGSACCIAGHIALRMREPVTYLARRSGYFNMVGQKSPAALLFSGGRPSDPQLAADAIGRFVIGGSDDPWKP
jgi:hypothetical protein